VTALYISEVFIYIKKTMYLRRNSDIYEYNTRRKCDFQVVIHHSLSVINMGIRLYNKMPTRIKQLNSFRDFKRKVKLFLTLRRLMSYIYGAPILDVSRSHTTTQHSR